jgi:molybdate transport system regulatory protein
MMQAVFPNSKVKKRKPVMKVSARNVFKGKVSQVQAGAVNAEVVLTLAGGEQLVAVVTMESIKNLGIAVGKEAVALVKAPWVMLMTESSDIRLSARNCLEGKVLSVTDGAVNAEVVIELAGGSKVYSIVTRDAVAELGLAKGVSATAVIKASHIILGVPA